MEIKSLEASKEQARREMALFSDGLYDHIDNLKKSLKAAQDNTRYAEATIERLKINLQSQQTQILQLKAANLGAKVAVRQDQPGPKLHDEKDAVASMFKAKVEVDAELCAENKILVRALESLSASEGRLKNEIENTSQKYEDLTNQYNAIKNAAAVARKSEVKVEADAKLRAKNQILTGELNSLKTKQGQLKTELKDERQRYQKLSNSYEETKGAFRRFMSNVNQTGCCDGCKRGWNFSINHKEYTSINMVCKLCRRQFCYSNHK